MSIERHLILASGSPRRRELLEKMGYRFEIYVPEVDEKVSSEAREAVGQIARRKAEAVAAAHPEAVVIASDTLVSLDGRALGKPADIIDAMRMLKSLSGREHEVYTGVCVIDALYDRTEVETVLTTVHFRPLTDAEIVAYISTGEPMDKAGAYGIQGGARDFVDRLDGSFENVMGFPVDEVDRILRSFGLEPEIGKE